jgi:putative Ca2+/H+ antiporter (TMEM165/GDT1 family)
MHSLRLAAYVFGVIFVAELPDKTALAALVLATRHRPLPVFLGASLALTVQSVVAVLAGSLLSLLPARAVHVGAGLVFLASAVVLWIRKEGPPEDESHGQKNAQVLTTARRSRGRAVEPRGDPSFWRSFATVFGVVFVAEWGDLTQFATAAFAANERAPLVIFVAATLALWAVAGLAVGIGNRVAKVLDPNITKRVAALLFVAVAVALLAGWL